MRRRARSRKAWEDRARDTSSEEADLDSHHRFFEGLLLGFVGNNLILDGACGRGEHGVWACLRMALLSVQMAGYGSMEFSSTFLHWQVCYFCCDGACTWL